MAAIPPESTDIVETIADYAIQRTYGEHSNQIEKIIYAALQEIFGEIIKLKPYFKVSEILKVGSFNEGTKILEPDEFDYIVVLEKFSEPGLLDVEKDETHPEIVKLKMSEACKKDGKLEGFTNDGYLRCMQPDYPFKSADRQMPYETFQEEVRNAVWRLNHDQNERTGERDRIQYTFTDKPRGYDIPAHKLDKALIKRVAVYLPNVVLEFVIENKIISVDLSPAIRYANVRSCFVPEDCFSPKLAEFVLNRESILLVGQLDNKFRITFTETEVDYLKNTMSSKHKKLYIYLKYVALVLNKQGGPSLPLFPSYTLKLACIQHDLECAQNEDNIRVCLGKVLVNYSGACNMVSLPSVFNKQLDIMKSSTSFRFKILERDYYLLCFRKIQELVDDNASFRMHDFRLRSIASKCRAKYEASFRHDQTGSE